MFFSQGLNTLKVPMSLHAKNRAKVLKKFKGAADVPEKSIILLKGGCSKAIDDSDIEYTFKQESYFQYFFGVMEPDFYGVVEIDSGKTHLFLPVMDPSLQVVLGENMPPKFYADKYEVDAGHSIDDLEKVVKELDPSVIYVMSGINTDSGIPADTPWFGWMGRYRVDKGRLVAVASECRVHKSKAELEVMRYAIKTTSEAHKAVMRACKPGMMEYQLEATFLHHIYFYGGCRQPGYTPICASGEKCATLHYGHAGAPNNKAIKDGDMVLIDCGAEYHCYDGDLTTTFPANGKFTPQQRELYNVVYAMLRGVEAAMKPGVCWADMHLLANRIACEKLKEAGYLTGDVDEMCANDVGAAFMPHGLGHLIGLDTHDVGGYPRGTERIMRPGLKKLRTTRKLEPKMVITVEPGIYFSKFALEPAFTDKTIAKFFVQEKLRPLMSFGGIRLEDNVLITKTGIEVLDDVPRTCEEIENWMAGRPYK